VPPKTKVKIDQAAVRRLAQPGGVVYSDLQKRARKVERKAKALAPKGMRRFITTDTSSGHVRVECTHPAAIFVIKGTRRHIIRPRTKQALKFKIGGRTVFAKIVHHPGTKPNDFMTKALREAR
jgi:hypothetical protein